MWRLLESYGNMMPGIAVAVETDSAAFCDWKKVTDAGTTNSWNHDDEPFNVVQLHPEASAHPENKRLAYLLDLICTITDYFHWEKYCN